MIQNCLNFWTYFIKIFEILTFSGQKMAFLRKQRWKIFIFHADLKKTKNAPAISKIILRRTKKIICCLRTFISKYCNFWTLRNSTIKVSFSLGSRQERLREAAWRGQTFFLENCIFWPLKVKISKKFITYVQKFSQFYVRYQHIVQFDNTIWELDCFEKSVLK